MKIRAETPSDIPGVRAVNEAAFGTPAEANLVDALRERASPVISLVADDDGAVVGHILFSPVTLSGYEQFAIIGLAPLAVTPPRQRSGIGSALVRAGLDECARRGFGAAIVLGHAEYYPRFGFVPASRFGIRTEYDVPDEVFMARELVPGFLSGKSGTIRYHPEFAKL